MNKDVELALLYAPIVHFDRNDPIPPRAVGVTVFGETKQSASFPKRRVEVPEGAAFTVEYAYYFDYDIGHMYDLEHVWVTVRKDGAVMDAQGSFHGKFLNMLLPGFPGTLPPEGTHVHAFCQPGKHAFLAAGELTRLFPKWDACCGREAGGPVLIGNPFCAEYSPSGKDLFVPDALDDELCVRYMRERLSFEPSLEFEVRPVDTSLYMPWETLFGLIPRWIRAECGRLRRLYGRE
ncbi:MAG: hypothetical protein IKP22_13635 [Clostridia bacterium]|nr:hypothetical protein [Clostridia bacterium]